MELQKIIEAISLGQVSTFAILILTLIQIAPIKVNPWSYIGKAIGRFINAEVLERQEKLEKKVDSLDKKIEEAEEDSQKTKAEAARKRILRFNDELLHDQNHSKEMFDDILEDIELYESYYKTHEIKNGKAKHAVQNINTVYDKRMEKKDFL